ncbi:DUF2163 domain-containing protein [Roseinatronobacter sp.]
MKSIDAGLAAHLASGATTLAWCWRITRADGQVFGFTDHDRPLQFDGTSFESEAGLIPSELRHGSDMAVDAQDAEGVLSSERITETDIADGRWDNAGVEVFRVNWRDTSQRVLLRRGSIGDIRRGRVSFVAEVRSMAHVLNQQVGRVFQNSCDAALGDARCKVDLEAAAFKGSGAITELFRDRAFVVSGLSAFDAGLFSRGTITWISGANTGRRAEISRHEVSNDIVRIILLEAPVRPAATGDAFTIRAGCDKRRETCHDRFANIANYRGFPDIPGQDAVTRYATKDGGHRGRVL